jgi:hypothetical protein
LRFIIHSVKISKKQEENESEINERKEGKERKTSYKEGRVRNGKQKARIS